MKHFPLRTYVFETHWDKSSPLAVILCLVAYIFLLGYLNRFACIKGEKFAFKKQYDGKQTTTRSSFSLLLVERETTTTLAPRSKKVSSYNNQRRVTAASRAADHMLQYRVQSIFVDFLLKIVARTFFDYSLFAVSGRLAVFRDALTISMSQQPPTTATATVLPVAGGMAVDQTNDHTHVDTTTTAEDVPARPGQVNSINGDIHFRRLNFLLSSSCIILQDQEK